MIFSIFFIFLVLAYGKKYGAPWWNLTKPIVSKNALNGHLACWGLPGTGKSSFILAMILQLAIRLQTFILFDTHSDLFRQVLAGLINYGWKPENVIIIDPADQRFGAPGINVFDCEPGREYEAVGELLSAFRSIWKDSWGARMEDILRNSFLALQEAGLTLAEASRFLTDDNFRNLVLAKVKNPDVNLFWKSHFLTFKESERKYFIESSRNKLGAFLASPLIKPIFSQSYSTINFANVMNQGKAILINLNRNRLKESLGLFGALLLSKIALACFSREAIPKEQRNQVVLLCDEHHEYFIPEFNLLMATGSRKFGLSYQVFSQTPEQYGNYIDILFGTFATQVAFGLDRKAGERLAKELFSFTGQRIKSQKRDFWGPIGDPKYYSIQEEMEHAINELTNQKVGECYIRIKGSNDDGNPYIAKVPNVIFPKVDPSKEEAFRRASAEIYYTPFGQIEEDKRQRLNLLLSKPENKPMASFSLGGLEPSVSSSQPSTAPDNSAKSKVSENVSEVEEDFWTPVVKVVKPKETKKK